MDWASVADWAVKTGVPSALGVVIVYYLLAKLIPKMVDTYERTLATQQASFERAISTLQAQNEQQRQECAGALRDLHEMIRAEGVANRQHRAEEETKTREALEHLTQRTHELGRAVFEMHGGALPEDTEPLAVRRGPGR